jgi:hypothetical protein
VVGRDATEVDSLRPVALGEAKESGEVDAAGGIEVEARHDAPALLDEPRHEPSCKRLSVRLVVREHGHAPKLQVLERVVRGRRPLQIVSGRDAEEVVRA